MEVQVQRWWCRGCLEVVLRCIDGAGAVWVLRFSSGDCCAGQMQRREEQEMQWCSGGEGEEVLRRC
jgi:hypothetical protein